MVTGIDHIVIVVADLEAAIAERLRMRGPSPFEVTLSAPHAHPASLDPAHTCGARLIIA